MTLKIILLSVMTYANGASASRSTYNGGKRYSRRYGGRYGRGGYGGGGRVACSGGCAGTSFCGSNGLRRRITVRTVGSVFTFCSIPFARLVTGSV